MATHSSILAWRLLWAEESGGLQSMGSQSWTWLSDWACTLSGDNWEDLAGNTAWRQQTPLSVPRLPEPAGFTWCCTSGVCVGWRGGWMAGLVSSWSLSGPQFSCLRTSGVNGFQGPSRLHHSESLSSLSFQCLARKVIMQVKQEVGWALLVNGIPAAC